VSPFLEINEAGYHADPCEAPSFSASLGKVILDQSPLHAYLAHPRLGGAVREPSSAMEFGTLVHKLILGEGASVVSVNADNWKKSKVVGHSADEATAQDIYVRYPGLRQSFSVQEVTDMLSSTSGELERRLIGKGRRPFLIMDRWALADVHLDLCLSRLLSSADTTLNDERFRTASVAHMKAYEEGFGRLNFRYDFSESGDVAVAEPAEAVTPLVLTGARQGSFWW